MELLFVDSSGGRIVSAVVPLLKFLCLCVMGFILSHRKIQLIPKSTLQFLSKLVFFLFLPCLIFTHLGHSITLHNIILWWFIPVNVVLSTSIGCLLGWLVAVICRPPPQLFRFTIIMTAFGNTGNLALAVVASVCHSTDNPFGSGCYGSGVSYVSFSQWVSGILVYTLVYHMMEPPLEYCEIADVEGSREGEEEEEEEIEIETETENETQTELATINNDLSRPLLVEAEWPGLEEKETQHCKTPLIATLFNGISSDHLDLEVQKSIRCLCLAEPKIVRKIRIVAESTPMRYILQPPTIASFLAMLIGVVPFLKSCFFGDDAPLVVSVLVDSLDIVAAAMVPSAMLVLGGMLAEAPKESSLGIRTTIGIIVARLLILPVIGIGVVHLADRWNLLLAGDELYRFVLLVQYTTPSAILLGAIASLRGYAVKEASALLFWQHVFAVFTFSFYIIIYYNILFSSSNLRLII